MQSRYFRAENGTTVNALLTTCIIGLSNIHNSYFLQLTFKKLADVEEMERPGKLSYISIDQT